MGRVCVIVLGDVGRSPRMQYHSHSLAGLESIQEVVLVGYEGEVSIEPVRKCPKIREVRFKSQPNHAWSFPWIYKIPLLRTFWRGLDLLVSTYESLLKANPDTLDIILIQNPPCIPVAIVAVFLSLFYPQLKIVIDWHNLGFKMFESNLGSSKHPLVQICYAMEFVLAHCCHGHVCVSEALRSWLQEHFFLHPQLLYDRPFHRMFASNDGCVETNDVVDIDTRHQLFLKHKLQDHVLFLRLHLSITKRASEKRRETLNDLTLLNSMTIQTSTVCECCPDTVETPNSTTTRTTTKMRSDRCHVLITSTSWTPDEDMTMLLDSLLLVDKHLRKEHELRLQEAGKVSDANKSLEESWPKRLLLLITGKGPGRDQFMERVRRLTDIDAADAEETSDSVQDKLMFVAVKSLWLEAEEYPVMMSCADVGVSMHTSTSGLDLPMKIMDMFGCGLPVIAASFNCIHEIIINDNNGIIINDKIELADAVKNLLFNDPCNDFNVGAFDDKKGGDTCRRNLSVKFLNTMSDVGDSSFSLTPVASGAKNVEFSDGLSPLGLFSPPMQSNAQNATADHEQHDIQRLRCCARDLESWDENWSATLAPVINKLIEDNNRNSKLPSSEMSTKLATFALFLFLSVFSSVALRHFYMIYFV